MSYVTLSSEYVRELAQRKLAHCDEVSRMFIERAKDAEVKRGWFRRLFCLPAKSRESVTFNDDFLGVLYMSKAIVFDERQLATRLLNACNHSDTVTVSIEDLELLT